VPTFKGIFDRKMEVSKVTFESGYAGKDVVSKTRRGLGPSRAMRLMEGMGQVSLKEVGRWPVL